MSTFVIPTCHVDHAICNYCFEAMKKETCPFCRADYCIADIENYATPGPSADAICVPDDCKMTLVRGRTRATGLNTFVKKYVPESVLNNILGVLPPSENIAYRLDPIKTCVEVDVLGKMNLLQYAFLHKRVRYRIATFTENFNTFKTILAAQTSLQKAIEDDLIPYDVFNETINQPIDETHPEVQLFYRLIQKSSTVTFACEKLVKRISTWPNGEAAPVDRSDLITDIAMKRLLSQGTVTEVDDRYVILS